jgi:hypothetical protein
MTIRHTAADLLPRGACAKLARVYALRRRAARNPDRNR